MHSFRAAVFAEFSTMLQLEATNPGPEVLSGRYSVPFPLFPDANATAATPAVLMATLSFKRERREPESV